MTPRRTRQLATVHAIIRAAHDHPTAEEVCARVRRRLPRISLGTVYRNLQKLAAQRALRIVHVADRPTRYDPMVQDHDHFLCETCGKVSDLTPMAGARRGCSRLRAGGYEVRAQTVTFYGRCPQCRGAKRKDDHPGRSAIARRPTARA